MNRLIAGVVIVMFVLALGWCTYSIRAKTNEAIVAERFTEMTSDPPAIESWRMGCKQMNLTFKSLSVSHFEILDIVKGKPPYIGVIVDADITAVTTDSNGLPVKVQVDRIFAMVINTKTSKVEQHQVLQTSQPYILEQPI